MAEKYWMLILDGNFSEVGFKTTSYDLLADLTEPQPWVNIPLGTRR